VAAKNCAISLSQKVIFNQLTLSLKSAVEKFVCEILLDAGTIYRQMVSVANVTLLVGNDSGSSDNVSPECVLKLFLQS